MFDFDPGNPLGRGYPLGSTLREDGQSHTQAWLVVLRADACSYCVAPAPAGTVDHITPSSHGGRTRVVNLTGACSGCNEKKGADLRWLAWMAARSRQPLSGH